MTEQDIPGVDESLVQLPQDIRADLAERGKRDLFFLTKGVLGFRDMTESCHGPLCVFVDQNPAQFKGILMPRDHYKTSLITIGATIQRVVREPESRQLIRNESATNSQRFLRGIRQQAEKNRVFRALYSGVIPKNTKLVRWNDIELDFNREGAYPEPSIDTIGITGASTSRHYTHITDDDLISEDAVQSEKVMADTIERLRGTTALLVDPSRDTYWMVGTRWALHDVYSWARKTYDQQMVWFARGVTEFGVPIFPEKFPVEVIALKRRIMGEYKFSCLMMNNPRNEELQDLNIKDLRFFRFEKDGRVVVLTNDNGEDFEVYALDQLDITTTVDLAPAEKATDDRNAVVTVGVTPTGKVVVLEAWGKRCTPLELIEKLFEVKARFNPRFVAIEGVAYQKAFKYFFKQECENRQIYIRIEEFSSTAKKEIRIRGLQPVMATGRLFIDPTALILRDEMSDFPLGEHDDVLDALASQLQYLRGVLSPEKWKAYDEAEQRLIRKLRAGDSPPATEDLDAEEDYRARTEKPRHGSLVPT